jgi:L-histidine N-alpha-methyltransferase
VRLRVDELVDEEGRLLTVQEDVRQGLSARPRALPPKYFYDDVGSALFERITELPEYYLTRVETALLADLAPAVMQKLRPDDLVELGPGSSAKTRWFLDAVDGDRRPIRYVPVDVDRRLLHAAGGRLAEDYPFLEVHGIAGDFERHLGHVPPPRGRRLVLFLGSTIGNFEPAARRTLLRRIRALLGPDDHLLIGVDLVKDVVPLEAAYNDAAGVTGEFNRNILHVVNREVGADFRPEAFRHVAFFNRLASRIEMHLVTDAAQAVRLGRLGLTIHLAPGESIWTESSYKFTRDGTRAMLEETGLGLVDWHADAGERFALALATPLAPAPGASPARPEDDR